MAHHRFTRFSYEMMNEFAPLDALAVGVNVVDVIVQLPDHFTPGEKQPARDLVVQGGGPAATAACVLGALGWRTGFVTPLGDNALSTIPGPSSNGMESWTISSSRIRMPLAKKTTAQLIVTDGVHGSWALTGDGVLYQPAFAVAAVDTTGCGDAFHGAYGAGILGGLPLRGRMELAAWVAAQVACGLGGRNHLPTRDVLRHTDWSVFSSELRAGLLSPQWNSAPSQTLG